jgi:hypothetical protein
MSDADKFAAEDSAGNMCYRNHVRIPCSAYDGQMCRMAF